MMTITLSPTMSRAQARAMVEGCRLSWSAFEADEGQYPSYPLAVVSAWCRSFLY